LVLAKLAASFLGKQKSGARVGELRFEVITACLSANDHAVFRFVNGAIRIFNRANTPATFVMLCHFKPGAGRAEMFQRATDRVRRRRLRALCRVYDFIARRVGPRI
jgi:hypothetical protein